MISYKQYRLLNEMTTVLGLGNPQGFLQSDAQLEEAKKKKKMFGGENPEQIPPSDELGDEEEIEDEEGDEELDGEEIDSSDEVAPEEGGEEPEGKLPPKFSKKKMTKEEYEWLEKLNNQLSFGLKEAKKKMFGDDDDAKEVDAETGDGEIISKKDAPPKDKKDACVEKKVEKSSKKEESTDEEKEFIAILKAQMTHGLKSSSKEYGQDYSKFVEDSLLAPADGTQSEPKPGEVGYAPSTRLGGPLPTYAEWLNER